MAKRKVYLPKWQRWFLIPTFVGIWALITYMEFFNEENAEQLGIVGYLILSAIFLGLGIMMWLMTSGKLPAYMIDDNNENSEK